MEAYLYNSKYMFYILSALAWFVRGNTYFGILRSLINLLAIGTTNGSNMERIVKTRDVSPGDIAVIEVL